MIIIVPNWLINTGIALVIIGILFLTVFGGLVLWLMKGEIWDDFKRDRQLKKEARKRYGRKMPRMWS